MKTIILFIFFSQLSLSFFAEDVSLKKKNVKHSQIQDVLYEISADSINASVQSLQNFGTRFALASNRREIAIWLKNKFISIGYADAVIDSFLIHKMLDNVAYDLYQYNIIATIQGDINPDQINVLGAHYDSFSSTDAMNVAPGADDNASGAAATIEVARVMKRKNFQPASTIQFVLFGAEELMGSPGCGSCDYAGKAVSAHKNIRMMINYDMISNSSSSLNYVVNINRYNNSSWLSTFSAKMITDYTNLSILLAPELNSNGSDSWNFYQANYATIYFEEAQFSPVYHSPTDILSNCNFPYCAEMTKVSCAILMEDNIRPVTRKIVAMPENRAISIKWDKNSGGNILGYNLYRSVSAGANYEKINFSLLHDTTFIDTNVIPFKWYYYAAVTVNSAIEESEATTTDSAFIPTFNQGVLIIDDSQSELLLPSDATVDNFYDSLFTGYPHTQIDVLNSASINLADLGKYNLILWHTDRYTVYSKFISSHDLLKKYLQYGGKMIFTSERFNATINHISVTSETYQTGNFTYDLLHVDSMYKSSTSRFYGGRSTSSDYPDMNIDSLKTPAINNHHLANIESIFPAEGNIIYTYDTKFDSSSTSGNMKGLPVGIEYIGSDYKLITLSFPLWYVRLHDAQAFIRYVMEHKFNDPNAVEELNNSIPKTEWLICSPNPFSNNTSIMFYLAKNTLADLRVYNSTGVLVSIPLHRKMLKGFHTFDFSVQTFSAGMYYFVLQGEGFYKTTKAIILK